MSKTKLSATVATAIVIVGILFASTAWCAGAQVSKSLSMGGCVKDASNGNQLCIFAELTAQDPEADSLTVTETGCSNGPSCTTLWSCGAFGSGVASLLNFKIASNLTAANFNIDLTQLDCSGSAISPAAMVQMTCTDTGYFQRSVQNGNVRYKQPSASSSFHTESISYQASCTGSADAENFETSLDGNLAYQHSVQTGP